MGRALWPYLSVMVSKNKLDQGEIASPQTQHLSRKNAEVLYVKSLEQATKLDYLGTELVPRSTLSCRWLVRLLENLGLNAYAHCCCFGCGGDRQTETGGPAGLSRLGNMYVCMWHEYCTHKTQPLRYTQYHALSSPSTGGIDNGKMKVYDAGA